MADNLMPSINNENRMDLAAAKSRPNVKRSVFPLDCVHTTMFNEGALVPLDCFPVMPGDSFDLGNDILISVVNPFVDRMFSGAKFYVHAYYMKCEHIWKGWKNYATQGRRGNIKLSLPYVDFTRKNDSTHYIHNCALLQDDDTASYIDSNPAGGGLSDEIPIVQFDTPLGLPHYLGAPLLRLWKNRTISPNLLPRPLLYQQSFCGSNTQINKPFAIENNAFDGSPVDAFRVNSDGTSVYLDTDSSLPPNLCALPFGMYQRIYRDYYLNKNAVRDNPMWFPDDDEEFILPYSATRVLCMNERKPLYRPFKLVPNNATNVLSDDAWAPSGDSKKYADGPSLCALRYRQYDGDIFTTGLPFLERGGVTDMFLTAFRALRTGSSSFPDGSLIKDLKIDNHTAPSQTTPPGLGYIPFDSSTTFPARSSLVPLGNPTLFDTVGVFLNQNKLSELAVYSLWSQRNAHTDGDYSSMIFSHYSQDPHSEDRHPIYIGGTAQRLTFSEILQTSETQNSPLGTQAARAYSAGQGNIGHFECPDFGYIMVIGSLIPDTYYNQGLPLHLDPTITGSELPFPEFNSLPPQPLEIKRLYDSKGSSISSNLFSYVEPFIEYKYRNNRVSGLFTVNPAVDSKFSSMLWQRYFGYMASDSIHPAYLQMSAPNFNNFFLTASPASFNFSMYSVPSQPHYIIQYGSRVRGVRPMPFVSQQANYSNI